MDKPTITMDLEELLLPEPNPEKVANVDEPGPLERTVFEPKPSNLERLLATAVQADAIWKSLKEEERTLGQRLTDAEVNAENAWAAYEGEFQKYRNTEVRL